MNYPMKGKEIDQHFAERVLEKASGVFSDYDAEDVKDILLAAQEVMEEMNPEIKFGDTVRYENYLGVVHNIDFPEFDDRDYAFVIFDDGSRGIYLKEHLTKVEGD